MKLRITGLIMVAAIAALVGVGGSTAAWAQCPASPNYTMDFSTNGTCLTFNSSAGIVTNDSTVLRLTNNNSNQVGSAWFNTPQTVQNGFTTSFQFQFTGYSSPPADGIAFVIQNVPTSPLAAIGYTGGNGGALGYGDDDANTDPSQGEGIPNSLAIEFDTYHNSWDPDVQNNGDASHVAVQSCGMGPNTSHHYYFCAVESDLNSTLGAPVDVPNLADGAMHNVVIKYFAACSTCSPATPANIHVMLDTVDLYPSGVNVDLSSIGLGTGGSAYVGFTGATGADSEYQDILNWTFSQTAVVSTTAPTVFSFLNGSGVVAYEYTGQLNSGSPTGVNVAPIFKSPADCDALVQLTYPGAHCFVYGNLAPNPDSAVMFEVTCPSLPNSVCNPFDAELGTLYTLSTNPAYNQYTPAHPYPGLLKGDGGVAGDSCAQATPPNSPVFQSNQIDRFSATELPDPGNHGSSGGTGSCWVATWNQPDEVLPGITITSPTNISYAQGAAVVASYTCGNPTSSKLPELPSSGNPVGPYLTAASCMQATGTQTSCTPPSPNPGGGLACTGTVDTSTLGPQTFTVTAMDSGTNTSTGSVNYTVVAPTDLAIANVTLSKVATGSTLTYAIGVGDLGNATAVNVMVNDTLAPGTSFVSASGSNVACGLVNKKVSCQTIPFPCVSAGPSGPVSCTVGPIYPLSISSLNGAVIKVVVKVTAAAGTTLKNTATVSAANLDPKPSNNSSTASTTVTAH